MFKKKKAIWILEMDGNMYQTLRKNVRKTGGFFIM